MFDGLFGPGSRVCDGPADQRPICKTVKGCLSVCVSGARTDHGSGSDIPNPRCLPLGSFDDGARVSQSLDALALRKSLAFMLDCANRRRYDRNVEFSASSFVVAGGASTSPVHGGGHRLLGTGIAGQCHESRLVIGDVVGTGSPS